jgi:hypothetical protein
MLMQPSMTAPGQRLLARFFVTKMEGRVVAQLNGMNIV